MAQSKSDKLSIGDVISFIAILILGIAVFFGMNFKTLGDKIPSLVVSILLVVLMTLFVFLAAYAKAQNRNQDKWRMVEYVMLGLYVLALIPCYVYAAKFFDVQFNKSEILQQVQSDMDQINSMFADYNKKCDTRARSYQTTLEAMVKDEQGRASIARMLKMSVSDVNQSTVSQLSDSFRKNLKGGDYHALESEKENLERSIQTNFKNWNILFIPQDVAELDAAKEKYASKLQEIFMNKKNELEKKNYEFDIEPYSSRSNIAYYFTRSIGFSIASILVVILLGFLGALKYIVGKKRTVVELKKGDADVIAKDGDGFII